MRLHRAAPSVQDGTDEPCWEEPVVTSRVLADMVLKATVLSCLDCSTNVGLHVLGAAAARGRATEGAASFTFAGSALGEAAGTG